MPSEFVSSLPAGLFLADFSYAGDEENVLQRLSEYRPTAVICGSEFGVEVADELAARLGLRGNPPQLSGSRRDKGYMAEALARAGVPVARQVRAAVPEDVLRWRASVSVSDVVLKPIDSAGSEDVYFCTSDEEVLDAFPRIVGKENLMMRRNRNVLCQERLVGDEIVVNSVSRDGQHWFTDAWWSRKLCRSGRTVYDREDLIRPHDPVLDDVLPYVSDVLEALAIEQGPAHTELILTSAGPRLLETAARISGLANPPALTACTGADQVGLTVDCFLSDGKDLARRPVRYPVFRQARVLNLIADRRVRFDRCKVSAAVSGLPGFHSARLRVPHGGMTRVTVDLNSSPGVVFLVHENGHVIEQATEQLRKLEREIF